MNPLGVLVSRKPRVAAALAFGGATSLVTFLLWLPAYRKDAKVVAISIAAGAAHALAAAIMARRLLDGTRTRTARQALQTGALTSLLAVPIFSPPFAVWVLSSNVRPMGVLPTLGTMFYVALFSFLAVGWALVLVSAGVGWILFRLAVDTGERQPSEGIRP